jgi:hypothetical protein
LSNVAPGGGRPPAGRLLVAVSGVLMSGSRTCS